MLCKVNKFNYLGRRFDINRENISSWFSSLLIRTNIIVSFTILQTLSETCRFI